MYPIKLAIFNRANKKIYKVRVDGYQMSISYGAFKSLNENVAYEVTTSDKATVATTLNAYEVTFDIRRKSEVLDDRFYNYSDYEIVEEQSLYEFYDMIGYDKKTKKINGLTMRQHIKKCIVEHEAKVKAHKESLFS